jgi:hypothetical protein
MQNVLAIIIVALAATYLAWRAWQFIFAKRKAAGCSSGCQQCPATNDSPTLVNLEVPLRNKKEAAT